jgi:hypothetical protein
MLNRETLLVLCFGVPGEELPNAAASKLRATFRRFEPEVKRFYQELREDALKNRHPWAGRLFGYASEDTLPAHWEPPKNREVQKRDPNAPRKRSNKRLPDSVYQQVAEICRDAIDNETNPTTAVAEAQSITRAAALKRIQSAKQLGFFNLEETEHGTE